MFGDRESALFGKSYRHFFNMPTPYRPQGQVDPEQATRDSFEQRDKLLDEQYHTSAQIFHALKGVIDDASYGWNPLLEDQVHWCVWSAPDDPYVALLFDQLAFVLMQWGMVHEAKVAYQKALSIRIKLKGMHHPTTISTMVLLSKAAWKAGSFEEGLILLETAGDCFATCGDGHLSLLATRCFLKAAADYDYLGWHQRAQAVWEKVFCLA